jgi:quercetin dioxygenase-like cupin family protein
VNHFDWSAIPVEKMNEKLSRQVIHTEHLTVARIILKRGANVPDHRHSNEQFSMILSGALKFVLSGEEVIVRSGQALPIPSYAPHSAEALEDTVAIDVFTPPRADWISGDDAYLRG